VTSAAVPVMKHSEKPVSSSGDDAALDHLDAAAFSPGRLRLRA